MEKLKEIPEFDIFLPCAPKDAIKLPYVIKSIEENIKGYSTIWICSPVTIEIPVCESKILQIIKWEKIWRELKT